MEIESETEPKPKFKLKLIHVVFAIIGIIFIKALFFNEPSRTENQSQPVVETPPQPTTVNMREVLHTHYFDFVITDAYHVREVNTGNEYTDLPAERGAKYIVLEVAIKNTDRESRMLFSGSLWVNYNGVDYQYDKAETILADGWMMDMQTLNPLMTKAVHVVYKIPSEMEGLAYWVPGRATNGERIVFKINNKQR